MLDVNKYLLKIVGRFIVFRQCHFCLYTNNLSSKVPNRNQNHVLFTKQKAVQCIHKKDVVETLSSAVKYTHLRTF